MKKQLLLALCVFFTAIPASYAADVYRDCTNLVVEYAYHRDRFDGEGFASLFTDGASLTVGGQTWVGRAAIRGRIEGLQTGSSIRHLMSTIRIVPVDDDHATGVSYVTIYSAPPGQNTVEGFTLVGEYHDTFLRTAEGWKIQNRVLQTIYTYADQ